MSESAERLTEPLSAKVYKWPCIDCIHWFRGTQRCAAFRLAIPREVLTGADPHTSPIPGDGGLRFRSRP